MSECQAVERTVDQKIRQVCRNGLSTFIKKSIINEYGSCGHYADYIAVFCTAHIEIDDAVKFDLNGIYNCLNEDTDSASNVWLKI